MTTTREITVAKLIERYPVLLLDAYGVLVDTGVADPANGNIPVHLQPTYRIRSVELRQHR